LQYYILDDSGNKVFDKDIYSYSSNASTRLAFLWSCRQGDKIRGFHWSGVWVSLGLISSDIKPSTLGFTALGTPFHRDPCHWAPPALGNPSPQLPLHCFLWVIAVGKPPHPGFLPAKHTPLGSPRYTRISRRLPNRGSINNTYKPI